MSRSHAHAPAGKAPPARKTSGARRRVTDDRRAKVQVTSSGALRTRRKFLRIFPAGFRDQDYVELERSYKWNAHLAWRDTLDETTLRSLVDAGQFQEIATRAVRIESRTNLLFSFEKMALRDAIKPPRAAELFATALLHLLHGDAPLEERFSGWIEALGALPRKQTRVLIWPLATVFGFIARPSEQIFFKPMVTREAARRYGYPLDYSARPDWSVYRSLLRFAATVRADLRDLRPRDMIDIQSFLWVQGSEEYPGR